MTSTCLILLLIKFTNTEYYNCTTTTPSKQILHSFSKYKLMYKLFPPSEIILSDYNTNSFDSISTMTSSDEDNILGSQTTESQSISVCSKYVNNYMLLRKFLLHFE